MTWFVAVQDGIPFATDPAPLNTGALVTAFVVVAIVGAVGWALRHRLPAARGRQVIAVETAVSLGERRSLVVVSVENRRLLLGLTPQQVSLVTELGASVPADTAPPGGTPFSTVLQASIGGTRS